MAVYNTSRFIDGLLKSHETSQPSFTVRLYREHWTLNSGSKFLYNNQIASLLDDIRTRHIPVDFLDMFDTAKVPFYQGCLIVELLDYRPSRSNDPELEQPEASRVVLTPNDESRWKDICLMNQKTGLSWTDADSVEIESRLLMATAPPLCLTPDLHLTRIVNATQRTTTPPVPPSLKRKASAMDQEADEVEKARRVKITQFMNPRGRSSVPTYRILDAIQKAKLAKERAPPPPNQAIQAIQQGLPTAASPHPQATTPAQPPPAHTPTPVPAPIQHQHPPNASSPAPSAAATPPSGAQDAKKLAKRNSVAGQSPRISRASVTPAPTAPSGAPLPIPPHLQQHYLAQRTATPTPPQAAASPRPPPQALAHASSPAAAPEQRPPSAVPAIPAQSGQPTPAQVQHHMQQVAASRAQPSPAPTQTQQQTMIGAYPAHMVMAQQQQLARRKAQVAAAAAAANAGTPVPGAQPHPQNYMQAQVQAQYMAYQAHAQAQQHQRITQTQQAASPAARTQTPIAQAQAQAAQAQRNSPMVTSRALPTRSPMPNPAQQAHAQAQQQQRPPQQHQPQQHQPQQQQQQPQQQAQPQVQHPQHPQHPQQAPHPTAQQQQLAYAQYMQRFAAQAQAQAHAQQHPQMHQPGVAQGGMQPQQAAAAAAAMQNPQMMAQYYNYARMPGMAMGQVPQAYWQLGAAGRGMPIPGMPGAHPQQMQPGAGGGAGKPAQGGQQGS